MKWIGSKWYVSQFGIPLIVGVLSGLFSWKIIQSNLLLSLFIMIVVYSIIVTVEFLRFYKSKIAISDHDKMIIRQLIKTLNLDFAQDSLQNSDGWNGYQVEHIHCFIDFVSDSKTLSNRIANNTIQYLIDDFSNSLDEFNNLTGNNLFEMRPTPGPYYVFSEIVKAQPQKRRELADKFNILSTIAYKKLERLVMELKQKEILIFSIVDNQPRHKN